MDPIEAAHGLPRHLWGIGVAPAGHSALRAEAADDAALADDQELAVLRSSHQRAIARAALATRRRVERLEQYADQVSAADRALEKLRAVERLAERSARAADLLAATARDDLGAEQFGDRAQDVHALAEVLRSVVSEAKEAADALVLVGDGVTVS